MAFSLPPGCSFWLSGVLDTMVDGTQDDSWRGLFVMWLYLAAKPSHMGGRCGRDSLPFAPGYDL
jgi:hypothetical protein